MTRLRLCRFVAAILKAEERRAGLETELARAEVDLDAAFRAFFEDYLRAPYSLEVRAGEMAKVAEVYAIWSQRGRQKYPHLFQGKT